MSETDDRNLSQDQSEGPDAEDRDDADRPRVHPQDPAEGADDESAEEQA